MSDSHKAKILIVDDESMTCFLLREYFEERYHVETAFNGHEALRQVKEFQPDCILLDIRMPGMDGIMVLKEARPSHPELKVIMMTAIGCADVARECLRLGAFAYTMKPIDLDALESQVQSALTCEAEERFGQDEQDLQDKKNF